jgi:AAA family ATP:ADP antiporter
MSSRKGFGKFRSFLWPIYRDELCKLIPMLVIFFFVGLNYTLLRITKDALVVTAPESGAEALPFIKVWAIVPMAFLFTFIFTRVSNKVSREKAFYWMMSIFLAFFALFTFVLYPLQDVLHPHSLADKVQSYLPIGCQGLVAMFRNWTFTAYYVMSEMWSTIIMTVLAWGFANEVTSANDAKRFYGLFGLAINLSTIAAGVAASSLGDHIYNPALLLGADAWGQSVSFLNCLIIVSGVVCMACFRYIHRKRGGYNSEIYKAHHTENEIKMGMRKNFAYLAKSKYLICIAVIVIAYNIASNLIEVVWKDQVNQLYPNPSEFNAYMGNVVTIIGIVATVVSIFVGTVIRKLSWIKSALIPPVILISTGLAFFSFLLFRETHGLSYITALFGTTPLALGVFFGSMQNCFARVSKYTFFDATKELSFIPLSKESKLKGKAAIDGVGSRLGKSGGSLIHQGLLISFGTVALSTPIVGGLLFAVIAAWIVAVKSLGKQFNLLTSQHQTLTVPESPEEQTQSIHQPAVNTAT